MKEVILIKLGEVVLKGLNRRSFEDVLLKNIRRRIGGLGEFDVTDYVREGENLLCAVVLKWCSGLRCTA